MPLVIQAAWIVTLAPTWHDEALRTAVARMDAEIRSESAVA